MPTLYVYVDDDEDPWVEAVTVIEYEPGGVVGDEFTYNVVEHDDPLVVHDDELNEQEIPEGAEQEKLTVVGFPFGLFKLAVTVDDVWVPGQTEEELEGFNWTDETETGDCIDIEIEILGITPFGGYALAITHSIYWYTPYPPVPALISNVPYWKGL